MDLVGYFFSAAKELLGEKLISRKNKNTTQIKVTNILVFMMILLYKI